MKKEYIKIGRKSRVKWAETTLNLQWARKQVIVFALITLVTPCLTLFSQEKNAKKTTNTGAMLDYVIFLCVLKAFPGANYVLLSVLRLFILSERVGGKVQPTRSSLAGFYPSGLICLGSRQSPCRSGGQTPPAHVLSSPLPWVIAGLGI